MQNSEMMGGAVVGCVLDESASMGPNAVETVQAFNTYLEGLKPKQATDAPIYVTAYRFKGGHPNQITPICRDVSVEKVKPLTDYAPNNSTPLWDAVGIAIRALDAAKERRGASKVILMVLTDGEENASVEYRARDIRKLIDEHKKQGWEIMFLGADFTKTYGTADCVGIGAAATVSMAKSELLKGFAMAASNTRSFVDDASASTSFAEQQRGDLGDRRDRGRDATLRRG